MIKKRVKKQVESLKEFRKDLSEPHKIINIGEGVFAVREGVFSYCFLITGEREALLIDSGIGIPGLREKVGVITGLPVIQVLTGASPWTVGNSCEFEETYVSSKDLVLASIFNNFHLRKILNLFDPFRIFSEVENVLLKGRSNFKKIEKEFLEDENSERYIDLGGRKVIIENLPSITRGGYVLKDEITGKVFCGSAASPIIFLFPVFSATAKEYYETVKVIRKKAGDKEIYSRFSCKPVMKAGMEEMENLMRREVNNGNKVDVAMPLRLVSSDRHIRFLLHFPARTERKSFKKKWEELRG